MRLTTKVLEELLRLNEGFEWTTSYSDKNFRETRKYLISGGKLLVRTIGQTSWADSRFDKGFAADVDQTRRFIRSVLSHLKVD